MRAFCPACRIERSIPFAPSEEEKHCPDCGTFLTKRPRAARPLERTVGPKRQPGPRPVTSISPASPAQRDKVRHAACVVCGRGCAEVRIDPAHIWPRGMGGCDDPACVIPLCALHHHHYYDDGELSILEHLEPHWREELAHAITHGGLIAVLQRTTGERWAPAREAA